MLRLNRKVQEEIKRQLTLYSTKKKVGPMGYQAETKNSRKKSLPKENYNK